MSLWGRHKRLKAAEDALPSEVVYARAAADGASRGETEECATFNCARCNGENCSCVCHG